MELEDYEEVKIDIETGNLVCEYHKKRSLACLGRGGDWACGECRKRYDEHKDAINCCIPTFIPKEKIEKAIEELDEELFKNDAAGLLWADKLREKLILSDK